MTAIQLNPAAAHGNAVHGALDSLHVSVVDDAVGFASLRTEWHQLLASSRADGLFLTWEWLYTWWRHLGRGRRLFVVTVRRGSTLIAVAPLTMTRTSPVPVSSLEFVGSGTVGSDYLDFIVHRDHEASAFEALANFLAGTGVALRLPSVTEDSCIASVFAPMLVERGWQRRDVAMQVCPYIDLSTASWDSYLASVGPSHRYNFRRRLRNLQKSYDVRLERVEGEGDRHEALGQVVDLHLRRWNHRGGSDAFHDDRIIAFHDEFSAIARDHGWLRLRVLTIDRRPVAAFYGFRYHDKYCFYQSGFDEAFVRESIGLVMIGLTIKEAIEERAVEYDFLHGDEPYKFLWAREARPLWRIELYPPGMLGRLHRRGVLALASTKKAIKRAMKRESGSCSAR